MHTPRLVIIEHDIETARVMAYELNILGVDVIAVYADVKQAKRGAPWERATACYVDYRVGDEKTDLLVWLVREHPHVTRILTTAYSNGGLPGGAVEAADTLLRKPFSIRALYGALVSPPNVHVSHDMKTQTPVTVGALGARDD